MPLSKKRQAEYMRAYRKRAKHIIRYNVIPKAPPVKPPLDASGEPIPEYW